MQLLLVFAVLADLAAGTPRAPVVPPANLVSIHSMQSGWGFHESSIDIVRFERGFTDAKRVIDPRIVDAIVAAALAPTKPFEIGEDQEGDRE